MLRASVLVPLLLLLLSACPSGTDGDRDGGGDAGLDAGADAGVDAGSDAGPDAGPDGGADAGPDGGADAGSDGGADAGPDGGTDAGPDGGVDAGPDGGPDAGPDGGTDAGVDGGCAVGTPCSDGNPCTTGDVCDPTGNCRGGAPVNCNDGDDCTVDVCDSTSGLCQNSAEPPGTPCFDANPCTTNDACDAVGQCQGTQVTCDDANDCTDDSCEPTTGLCVSSANTASCDDSDPCTDGDICSAALCTGPTEICCGDNTDNDGDLATDCFDNDCATAPVCAWTVGWCALQWPPTITGTAGSTATTYGRVWVAGLTDQTTGPEPSPSLVVQVGYGADGSDPAAGGWTWSPTVPNPGFSHPADDEYWTDLVLPALSGTPYDYAYRVSGDGGGTWLFCDTGNGSNDGYAPADAGQMDITP